jgi:hypothetical protein
MRSSIDIDGGEPREDEIGAVHIEVEDELAVVIMRVKSKQ